MRSDYVDLTIVLDSSGSMATIADDTINGLVHFINEQRNLPGLLRVTFVTFSGTATYHFTGADIRHIEEQQIRKAFYPMGCTALLDAVGNAMQNTGTRLANMQEYERPHKVMFVVITDGQENSSNTYTRERIKYQIEHQRQCYNWNFIFLGANQDSFTEAGNLGFGRGCTMNYAANAQSVDHVYKSMSGKMSTIRTGNERDREQLTSGGIFYNQSDYDAQIAAGASNPTDGSGSSSS